MIGSHLYVYIKTAECAFLNVLIVFLPPCLRVNKGMKLAGSFNFHQSTFPQIFRSLFSLIWALSQTRTVMTPFESHLATGLCGSPSGEVRSGREKFFFLTCVSPGCCSPAWHLCASAVTISHTQYNRPERSLNLDAQLSDSECNSEFSRSAGAFLKINL